MGDGRNIKIFENRWVYGERVKFKNEIMNDDSNILVWVVDLIEDVKWNEFIFIKWFKVANGRRIVIIYE